MGKRLVTWVLGRKEGLRNLGFSGGLEGLRKKGP